MTLPYADAVSHSWLPYSAIAGEQEVEAAVKAAEAAQPAWADLPGAERARLLRRWAELSEL